MAIRPYLFATFLPSLLLAACATPPATSAAQIEVDRQILEASQKIQAAQADLYRAGALNHPTKKKPTPISGNQQRIDVTWQGDALQLLNKLAHDRGLAFAFTGVRLPLPVSIDVKDAPYSNVLDMVRAQIGYRASIMQEQDRVVLQFNRPQC